MKKWSPPAKVTALFEALSGNKFASINSPTAGARDDVELKVGSAPLQLYSLATPNGIKVGIMLEELKAAGAKVEYDAHLVNIGKGDQFSKGFVAGNPNSKIPLLFDHAPADGGEPLATWESASILMYLSEKFGGLFMPTGVRERAECLNWINWQMAGQGPITGGGFGHFFVYAPEELGATEEGVVSARDYAVARFGMEVQRLCSVLDNHLKGRDWIVGDSITLADIICFPWFAQLRTGYVRKDGLKAGDFLEVSQYKELNRWADAMLEREGVQKGMKVCSWN